MKAFFMRLAVFLLPLVIGWLLLMIRPFDAHPGWTYLENNCRRGYFLHHHLYQESDTLDLAFIGSSRTMCAFNDSLMAELGSSHQEAVSVANLGTCFYGRDLQYLIVKRLLNRRPVRQIVLEIRATERLFGFFLIGPNWSFCALSASIFLKIARYSSTTT